MSRVEIGRRERMTMFSGKQWLKVKGMVVLKKDGKIWS